MCFGDIFCYKLSLKVVLTWAQIAIGILHSGIAHERQPNFRHRKKNRKIERGEFITLPRPTGRRSNKARIASVLNSFKNDPFYTHLVTLQKNFQYRCCISRENQGKSFVKIYVYFITYKDSFMAMIFFVFCS